VKEDFRLESLEHPFTQTIEFLKLIIQMPNPVDKFIALGFIPLIIRGEIDLYWKDAAKRTDIDNIQSIIVYTIIKS
jgi:hypothetical protein